MDPLSRAEELHSKLRAQLLAKDKLLAAAETKVKELHADLATKEKAIAEEKKQSHSALEAQQLQWAERLAEVEEREETAQESQSAASAAQTAAEAERAAAKQSVEDAEARVRQFETQHLALTRERDALAGECTADRARHHQQLIQLSQNHLAQTNDDIQRIAALRAECEQQKKAIAVEYAEKLVVAERTEVDLREQLKVNQERATEDAARWTAQKTEFEAIIRANAQELDVTLTRVHKAAADEMAMLQESIAKDARMVQGLQQWESTRAAKEAQWQQTKEELRFLRVELEKSIARYEKLEIERGSQVQAVRKELEATQRKLADTEANLAKKSQALHVYHREIKANQARLEEIKKLQVQQEKAHEQETKKQQAQIAALGGKAQQGGQAAAGGGKSGAPSTGGGGLGDMFKSMFTSGSSSASTASSSSEKNPAGPSAAAATAAAARKASFSTTSDPSEEGPRRSVSNADEELQNTLNEEMAVALSKRVEALEDERLTLAATLETVRRKLQQAELLNQLHATGGHAQPGAAATSDAGTPAASRKSMGAPAAAAGGKDAAPSTPGGGATSGEKDAKDAAGKKSSGGVFSSLLHRDPKVKDPLADPAHVRSLLEEQLHSNQAMTQAHDAQEREIRRLKLLLEGAKAEANEAKAQAKLAQATTLAKKKQAATKTTTATDEATASTSQPSSTNTTTTNDATSSSSGGGIAHTQ